MRTQYLDPLGIRHAVLGYDVGLESGISNPSLASAVVSAINDWNIVEWLDRGDPRLKGAILVSTQMPEDGAREIRRLGRDPRMAEVRVVANSLGKGFGHPLYHPIYEAAVEFDLPVVIHLGGDSFSPIGRTAGGEPGSRLEWHTLVSQPGFTHVCSFIVHGVFEKLPTLRLGIVEFGFAWLPWLLWNLDARVDALRHEYPGLTRKPSEYVFEHMFFSTQPLDEGRNPRQLPQLLSVVPELADRLLFATDYPHWDNDEPLFVQRHLPESWLDRVFYQNALTFYRFGDHRGSRI